MANALHLKRRPSFDFSIPLKKVRVVVALGVVMVAMFGIGLHRTNMASSPTILDRNFEWSASQYRQRAKNAQTELCFEKAQSDFNLDCEMVSCANIEEFTLTAELYDDGDDCRRF